MIRAFARPLLDKLMEIIAKPALEKKSTELDLSDIAES